MFPPVKIRYSHHIAIPQPQTALFVHGFCYLIQFEIFCTQILDIILSIHKYLSIHL